MIKETVSCLPTACINLKCIALKWLLFLCGQHYISLPRKKMTKQYNKYPINTPYIAPRISKGKNRTFLWPIRNEAFSWNSACLIRRKILQLKNHFNLTDAHTDFLAICTTRSDRKTNKLKDILQKKQYWKNVTR